uniref:Isopropylmalate dehydrogenase-like domain-containing protein n=1 Tax=Phenylobacterium glaciei TaxID=2803784 RepID=A0A974P0L7_9CAUL|nr:hypothetical protein JKL49_16735 [Phenylobacterium glaciei]
MSPINLKSPITVAHGDGIGPEIMAASLRVLEAAGAQLEIETVEIGEAVYLQGHSSGITAETWDSLRRTRVFYKAPISTPGRRVQVAERHGAQDPWTLRQRPPLCGLRPFRGDTAPEDGSGDHPGERGRPLCRDRAPADRRGVPVPEAGEPARLRADRALCL